MRYIKHILLPDEVVILDAKVHPVLLVPGLRLILLDVLCQYYYQSWFGQTAGFIKIFNWLYEFIPIRWLLLPDKYHMYDGRMLALIFGTWGVVVLVRALLVILFTELVITDRRVMAKVGVTTTTAIELDRSRIAGVVVFQTFLGRMLNYGNVYIQGFAGSIHLLPSMCDPYKIQKYLHARY